MKQLETLLSMDLDENVKELLNAVNDGVTKLNDANTEMVKTIESKERANADLIEDRKSLRDKLKDAESLPRTDDKTVQEKLDALNAEHLEALKAVELERDTIKTDMLNKTRFDEFGKLNVGSLLPKDWNDAQKAIAMKAIESQVLGEVVHDDSMGWVYKNGDVTALNKESGKPVTIQDRFNEIKSSGAIDMFLADNANSGVNVPPQNGTTQTTSMSKPLTPAQKAERMAEVGHEQYLKEAQSK